jgi:acetylornithine deacetylase/succinyl-diaminopimelate desuccinylase-like protein
VLEVGVRLLPGMEAEAVVERVIEATGAQRDGASSRPVMEILSVSPPLMTGGNASVVEALVAASGATEAGAVSYATDGGWLAEMGMDCAIWGPGSIEVAHKPDEFLPKADLARARELLVPVVERFCGGEA